MIRPIVPKQNKEVILSYVLDRHLHWVNHPTPQQNLLEEGEVDDGEVDVGEVEEEAVEEEAVGEEAVVPAVLVLVVLYYNFPPNFWWLSHNSSRRFRKTYNCIKLKYIFTIFKVLSQLIF